MVLFFQFKVKVAVHPALMKKKICEVNNFWYFFKKSWFHFMVFQEELASILSSGKPFSSDLEG